MKHKALGYAGLSAILAVHTWAGTILKGVVQDVTGRGIQDALVTLRSDQSRQEVAQGRTNSAGDYFISLLPTVPSREVNIAISAPGFMTTIVRGVRLNEQEISIRRVMLQVGAGCGSVPIPQSLRRLEERGNNGRLSGTIVDRSTKPVSSAVLKLICERDRVCGDITSDTAGHYTFSLAAGTYALRIRRPGYFDEEYGTYYVQAGFDTLYYPILMDRCQRGQCQHWRKPIARCE